MKLNSRYSLHVRLREIAESNHLEIQVVEVGLGFGDFATYLLDSVGDVMALTSVESWRGKFMKRRMVDCREEVLERMCEYCDDPVLYSYKVLEMDSVEGSTHFENDSLDCVYIDAGHDYRNVIADLRAWYPKVRSGGIFSGHDYKEFGVPGVRNAVNEFFKAYGLKLGVTRDVNPNPSWFCVKP